MRWPAFRKWNEHHTDPVDVDELTSVFGDLQKRVSTPSPQCWNQRRSMMHRTDRLVFSSATHVVQRSFVVIISGHVGPAPTVYKISTWGKLEASCRMSYWSCCHGSVPIATMQGISPVHCTFSTCSNCPPYILKLISNWLPSNA